MVELEDIPDGEKVMVLGFVVTVAVNDAVEDEPTDVVDNDREPDEETVERPPNTVVITCSKVELPENEVTVTIVPLPLAPLDPDEAPGPDADAEAVRAAQAAFPVRTEFGGFTGPSEAASS